MDQTKKNKKKNKKKKKKKKQQKQFVTELIIRNYQGTGKQ